MSTLIHDAPVSEGGGGRGVTQAGVGHLSYISIPTPRHMSDCQMYDDRR